MEEKNDKKNEIDENADWLDYDVKRASGGKQAHHERIVAMGCNSTSIVPISTTSKTSVIPEVTVPDKVMTDIIKGIVYEIITGKVLYKFDTQTLPTLNIGEGIKQRDDIENIRAGAIYTPETDTYVNPIIIQIQDYKTQYVAANNYSERLFVIANMLHLIRHINQLLLIRLYQEIMDIKYIIRIDDIWVTIKTQLA
jgi:hypothetical protein